MARLVFVFVCVAALVVTFSARALAQDGSNVLVVLNAARAGSEELAQHYVKARAVPSDQVLRVTTSTADEIDRARFERDIQGPIADWIVKHDAHDRILYFVLIKGIPLRVTGTEGREGTVASVDSELTLLYRKLLGTRVAVAGRVPNPFFQGDRPLADTHQFSHRTSDVYLVSRLDGFSDADVIQIIDRGAAPVTSGRFVLDERASLLGDRVGDVWLDAAAEALRGLGAGDRIVLDSSREPVTGQNNLLGYFSWGSNDPAITKRQLDLKFVPGALAAQFVSTDARTFKEPPGAWNPGSWQDPQSFFEGSPQSLVGDLIRAGATGVAGQVAEPYLDGTIRPQILFPAYVAGFNLIESFYLATPSLSWQTVVVGDPLCAPFRKEALPSDERAPAIDTETGLPSFFSERRLATLTAAGVAPEAAKPFLKALVRLAHDDKASAREALELSTRVDPRFVEAQFTLGVLYEGLTEYDKAIERYRVILAAAPNEIRTLNNLAYDLAVRKGAAADALPLAEKAYRLSNGNTSIADTLGWIRHLLGNESDAEQLLSDAIKAAPDNAEIHVHLAAVYAATKRNELALTELNRAAELDASLKDRDDVKALRSKIGGN